MFPSFLSTAAELRVKGLSQSFSGPNTGQGAAAAPTLPRSLPPQPSKACATMSSTRQIFTKTTRWTTEHKRENH